MNHFINKNVLIRNMKIEYLPDSIIMNAYAWHNISLKIQRPYTADVKLRGVPKADITKSLKLRFTRIEFIGVLTFFVVATTRMTVILFMQPMIIMQKSIIAQIVKPNGDKLSNSLEVSSSIERLASRVEFVEKGIIVVILVLNFRDMSMNK